MNSQTFGNYAERSGECEYLTLAFSPLSAPLCSRWRNNGLSADFLGDYVITFLPTKGTTGAIGSRQNEIKHAVTYIANELLENAMKYHERDVDIPIGIHLELNTDHITVSTSNGVGTAQAQRYQSFVERVLAGDPGEMLITQQEESAKGNESAVSCLGLLTMISDYGARLGWRFDVDRQQPQVMVVTTSAVLTLTNNPGAPA